MRFLSGGRRRRFWLSITRPLSIIGRRSFRLESVALIVGERLLGWTATFDHSLKISSQLTRLSRQLAQLCTDFFLWRQKFHPVSY